MTKRFSKNKELRILHETTSDCTSTYMYNLFVKLVPAWGQAICGRISLVRWTAFKQFDKAYITWANILFKA